MYNWRIVAIWNDGKEEVLKKYNGGHEIMVTMGIDLLFFNGYFKKDIDNKEMKGVFLQPILTGSLY